MGRQRYKSWFPKNNRRRRHPKSQLRKCTLAHLLERKSHRHKATRVHSLTATHRTDLELQYSSSPQSWLLLSALNPFPSPIQCQQQHSTSSPLPLSPPQPPHPPPPPLRTPPSPSSSPASKPPTQPPPPLHGPSTTVSTAPQTPVAAPTAKTAPPPPIIAVVARSKCSHSRTSRPLHTSPSPLPLLSLALRSRSKRRRTMMVAGSSQRV